MQDTTAPVNGTLSKPESKPNRGFQFAILGLIAAAFLYAYFVQPAEGQGTEKGRKSIMRWLVGHWDDVSNYSHGPLIPLISAGLIFRRSKRFMRLWETHDKFRTLCFVVGGIVAVGIAFDALPKPLRDQIKYQFLYKVGWDKYDLQAYTLFIPLLASLAFYLSEQEFESSNWGLPLILFGVAVYWVAIKGALQHPVVVSFIVLLYGVPLYLWGRKATSALVFPIAFLFLMVPLNFLDRITVPLANLATACAGHICNTIGVEVVWVGTKISSAKGAFQFEIAEGCSGIRSLVALGMVTAVYAYLTEPVQWKRWAIFFASLPLAIIGNIARVTTILLVAQAFGQEAAGGLYHDYSSFIFFPVALLGMVVFAALLNLNYQHLWERINAPAHKHPVATASSPAAKTDSEPSPSTESPI
jgi:exosortase